MEFPRVKLDHTWFNGDQRRHRQQEELEEWWKNPRPQLTSIEAILHRKDLIKNGYMKI